MPGLDAPFRWNTTDWASEREGGVIERVVSGCLDTNALTKASRGRKNRIEGGALGLRIG